MTHWADKIATELVELRPDVDVYTCASGISPSGQIHIGNLRDIATIFFVGRALADRGKRVRLLHSWDDYDRFRKVPKPNEAKLAQLPAWLATRMRSYAVPDSFEEHIGRPVAAVPDPSGEYESYAARFVSEFETSLKGLGLDIEFVHQAAMYPSGVYRDAIIESVAKRGPIYDILAKSKTSGPSEAERARFVPVNVYCDVCGKDSTRVSLVDGSETSLQYTCACGHDGLVDLCVATNVKLPWRVDWAMRWRHEGVVFEPFGKDHATAGGSYESSSEISREIFGYEPPVPAPYEFIGIHGLGGKMSSSTGVLLKPADLLEIYQPEIVLWMYARFAPMKQFDVAVDDQVLRMYDEFDRALTGDPQIESDERALELSRVEGRTVVPVPFRQLTGFAGIVQGNAAALESIFDRMGTPHRAEEFAERLAKADAWLERYVPDQRVVIRTDRDTDLFESLTDTERAWVRDLHSWLVATDATTIDEATERVYEIPKVADATEKENAAAQRRFFQIVYGLLFGRTRGPRLGTFLAAVPRERFVQLLDFS